MLLVACAIFVPRLKGDTAGHINSSHRGETLRDERPYLYLSFQGVEFLLSEWKTLQDRQTFHRQWPEVSWIFTSNSASSPNLTGYTFRPEISFVEGELAFLRLTDQMLIMNTVVLGSKWNTNIYSLCQSWVLMGS